MQKRTAIIALTVASALPVASADPSTPQLHPVEAVCIDYAQSGQMQAGTSTKCHRDYGYEQYELSELTIGIGGFSQSQSTFTVTIGDTIYAIDTEANTATETANPMYDSIANAVANSSSDDVSDAFLSAMGMTPNGQTDTVAGLTCTVYASSMMGTACFTDDGLMLKQSVMGNELVATNVTYTEGDPAIYRRHETATITQGPDLSNGLSGLLDQLQ